jgi:hypothetical protein
MAIQVICECGHEMIAKDESAGRRIKCRSCESPLLIPEPRRRKPTRDGSVRKRRKPAETYEDQSYDEDGYDEHTESQPPRRKPKRKGKRRKRSRGRPAWLIPATVSLIAVCVVGIGVFAVVSAFPIANVDATPDPFESFQIDVPPGMYVAEKYSATTNTDDYKLKVRGWASSSGSGGVVLKIFQFPRTSPRTSGAQSKRFAAAQSSIESLAAHNELFNAGDSWGELKEVTINGITYATGDGIRELFGPKYTQRCYARRDGATFVLLKLQTTESQNSVEFRELDNVCRTLHGF